MKLIFNKKILSAFAFIVFMIFLSYQSMYTIQEGYVALLRKKNASGLMFLEENPGLHLKLPFFIHPEQLDLRLRSFSARKSTLITKDKHPLVIHYYLKWKITDPVLYYNKTHNNIWQIQQNLAKITNTLLEKESAQMKLSTLLSNNHFFAQILYRKINTQVNNLGISLIDIGFESIDFPDKTDAMLLKNRQLEQARIALKERAIGKAVAANIRLQADNEAALQVAMAQNQAALIRGRGDKEAAKIYNAAYKKNPEFAAFYLKLEAYRKGFMHGMTNKNILVLNTKNDIYNANSNANSHVRLKS